MAITRSLSITYNSYTVDGTSGKHPHGAIPYRYSRGFGTGTFSFEFVITAASASALSTAVAAAEAAFRTPHASLSVTLQSQTMVSWVPGSGTAKNIQPSISKIGDPWDTGRSQLLAVTITADLPADKDSRSGRRMADVNLSYDASGRGHLVLEGEWTFTSSNPTASAQYAASFSTWASAVLSAIGGSWVVVNRNLPREDTDATVRFRVEYAELLLTAAASGIVDQSLTVSVAVDTGSGQSKRDGETPLRFATISVDYAAAVDRSVTTNLSGLYEQILPWLANRVRENVTSSALSLDRSEPRYDRTGNRLAISQTYSAALEGSLVSYLRDEAYAYSSGNTLHKRWSDTLLSKYKYEAPPDCTCTVTEQIETLSSLDTLLGGDGLLRGTAPIAPAPHGGEWVFLRVTHSPRATVKGHSGTTLDVVTMQRVSLWEAAVL